jgi:hypothetical protein
MVGSWAHAQHSFVDAVACDLQSMSLVETSVLGVLVHNWLVKVRPPGRVSCLLKQSCRDCTHGRGFRHDITVT